MRISQEKASQIAKQMTEKKRATVIVAEQAFKDAVTQEYKKQIPADVLRFYKKNPAFVKSTSCVRLSSHGFNYQYASLSHELPTDSGSSPNLEMTPETAKHLMKLDVAYRDAKKQYEDLKQEIETALYTLKTFKQIQEQLPEAVPFLPKSESTAIIPNLDGLRKKIKLAAA